MLKGSFKLLNFKTSFDPAIAFLRTYTTELHKNVQRRIYKNAHYSFIGSRKKIGRLANCGPFSCTVSLKDSSRSIHVAMKRCYID